MSFSNLLKRFKADESGATAIEYGLIASLVAVAIATVVGATGTKLVSTFESINSKLGS